MKQRAASLRQQSYLFNIPLPHTTPPLLGGKRLRIFSRFFHKAGNLPAPQQDNCLLVDESEIRRAVPTFPAGSVGGPDNLRPQHIGLRDMMICQESGHDFLTVLIAFVNLVLSGRCPSEVAPIFFGGHLLALNKKSGGIRPIAICNRVFTWAFSVQVCKSFGINRLRAYFRPNQLGVGTSGGLRGGHTFSTPIPAGVTNRSRVGET